MDRSLLRRFDGTLMKVITSHIGSDFDSLSSMVAASRLYEDAVLCFAGSATRNVREFLKRFGLRWQVLTPRKIDLDSVSMLVCVDVRAASRIGPFASLLGKKNIDVHVYDHHPPVLDPIPASFSLIDSVGATTTLLVEVLRERGVSISPQEATLFAMGIYEDTGALTFGATCRRDYEAVAYLRELGADMTMIPSHIEIALNAEERGLLDALVESARERYIRGAKVVFADARIGRYVDGLSLFVHRLRDYYDADVALAVVGMEQRTYVVGRSREGVLDMAAFLGTLGGGGHAQAASVTLTAVKPEDLLPELEHRIEECVEPSLLLRDVMSSPVMAVSPGVSVDDAYRVMIRYGHAALPLVEEHVLVGIITRKDLDKARLHGLGSVAVREFMTEGIVTVSPEASVEEAHRKMVLHNIGRLPVVRKGELVGIVTRTDMLRALYPVSLGGREHAGEEERPWQEDVSDLLERRLPGWVVPILRKLGSRAGKMGMRAYVAGGFVRDLLLHRRTLDIDVVVEGDAVPFLQSWRNDGCRVAVHARFRTGTIVFPENRRVDVATARREFYEYPVAQPRVSSDSLKHDLYRRDYAVNAMAVSINEDDWGTLLDYFGGRRDLQRKVLRVLHNLSFVEDPTRVFRGIRLEQRLRFRLEENSLRLLQNCVKGGLITLLSGVRLRTELEEIFREEYPYPAARRLGELGVWEMLFPGLLFGTGAARCLRRIGALFHRIRRDLPDFGDDLWLASLAGLLEDSPEKVRRAVPDRLHLAPRERMIVERALFERGAAEHELGGRAEKSPSEIVAFLRDVPNATTLSWAVATERWRVRRRILLYLTRLCRVRPMLTGRDLLDLGYRSGPHIGDILEGLLRARLEGDVETREEEIRWVLTQHPLGKVERVSRQGISRH